MDGGAYAPKFRIMRDGLVSDMTSEIASIEAELETIEASIKTLSESKMVLLKRLETIALSGTETSSIDERFNRWCEYSIKRDYSFIKRINTTSGNDLIQCLFLDKQRHQIISIESIEEIFEWLQEDLESGTSNFLIKKHQLTLSDLSEWKEELMKLNFGSCVMDW